MDLTPAAWDFLTDVAREWGASWARALMNAMAPTKDPRGPLIAELDGQPVLQTVRQKPTEQLRLT